MIAIVRIKGQVKVRIKALETLDRMNLKKKYSCVVWDKPSSEQLGMLESVKDFVAFGEMDKDTYKELVAKRGQQGTRFFRLHPPRGGIDSKKHFGVDRGVLGNNKEKINELVRRML